MSSFKVLSVDEEKKVVSIEVTFDDGEKYNKRMMVSGVDEDSVKADVSKWLSDYEPLREIEKSQPKVEAIKLNKSFDAIQEEA